MALVTYLVFIKGKATKNVSLRLVVIIKILKPFYGFLPTGLIPLPGIGLCKKWDYIETETSLTEKIKTIDSTSGKALIATIYLELDQESQQVEDILENLEEITYKKDRKKK